MLPLKPTFTPTDSESVDIFRLLEQLEELPEKAKHLPFNTLFQFDNEQFYYLVLKIRANLPEDMKKAQKVARESERILDTIHDQAEQHAETLRGEASQKLDAARTECTRLTDNARAEANRIIEEARRQASKMIEHSEICKMATSQANDMIQSAETESMEIRRGADDYAHDVLSGIETAMDKALVAVRRGREVLQNSRTH